MAAEKTVGDELRDLAIVADAWLATSRAWSVLEHGDAKAAVNEACGLLHQHLERGLASVWNRMAFGNEIGSKRASRFTLANQCLADRACDRPTAWVNSLGKLGYFCEKHS